jgi:hypothetical protein
MSTPTMTRESVGRRAGTLVRRVAPEAWLIPGLVVVALMLVWAVHNGGYDADTWYWGALFMLGLLAAIVLARGVRAIRLSRPAVVALVGFTLYVAWSYLSIAWATSPGDALTGSNRALLYLLVFAALLVLPWTSRGALIALLTFVIGVGVIAVVLLVRLASADHVQALVVDGRLASPTGYANATAALFTIEAITAVALAARRDLPALLRGTLIGFACAGLQLAVIVQSRAWLVTLPLVAIAVIVLMPDRLRVMAAAVVPVAVTVADVHRLLPLYQATGGAALDHAAMRAGHPALLLCALGFLVGTLIAWGESLLPPVRPSAARRRALGAVAVALACGAVIAGGLAVTHGHPGSFISRQLHGFTHDGGVHSGSHFTDVGSGRYDFWRVSLDAFLAHPVGGLGQDNFAEYYVHRRRTGEEPAWTHSLELRLLAHTGAVGAALFAVFLIAAIAAAIRARRRPGVDAAIVGAALLPLVVWLIHGSVDWFWEMPALTGPALGFLAVAAALDAPATAPASPSDGGAPRRRVRGVAIVGAAVGVLALVAAVVALGFPYLAVRETSVATDASHTDPLKSLADLRTAANLNPVSADPDRLAGTIALESGHLDVASERFAQAISRDPGGWYAWFGAGLAASANGDKSAARHNFAVAASINPAQPVVQRAISDLDAGHPLAPAAALHLLYLSL